MVQVWPNIFLCLDINSATFNTEIDATNMQITTVYVSLSDLDLILDLLYILFKFFVRLYVLIRARRKSARVCVCFSERAWVNIYLCGTKEQQVGGDTPKTITTFQLSEVDRSFKSHTHTTP